MLAAMRQMAKENMPDPIVPAALPTPAAPAAPATPPAPARPAQPTPGAATPPATPPTPGVIPAPGAPPAGMVPLPALQEERTKRQALEAELENLRRVNNQPQQPSVAPVDPRVELDKLWDTEPRKAVQVEIMYAMDWRDRLDANLNVQADQMANKYADFNSYRSAALGYVRSLPAHQRGAQGILEAAYYMVRGQSVDNLRQQWENEWQAKFQRGEITAQQLQVPAGAYSAPAALPGQVTLSADQAKVAEMMGLTPEQYASQIKITTPAGGR